MRVFSSSCFRETTLPAKEKNFFHLRMSVAILSNATAMQQKVSARDGAAGFGRFRARVRQNKEVGVFLLSSRARESVASRTEK